LVAKQFVKGKVKKGLAFPTCISINEVAGNYSPISDEVVLGEGDVVKIDLGAQIDGFISTTAHTVIATANPEISTKGKKADVVCAAHYAGEAALRLLRPGNTNTQVTNMINQIADIFKVTPVTGVISHELKKWVIDGPKVIISKNNNDHPIPEIKFEEGEVYSIDIMMSTGEGKVSQDAFKTTVFKRNVEQEYYSIKLQASRKAYSVINKNHPTLPFSMRFLSDDPTIGSKAFLGMKELSDHQLVYPYPVLCDKKGTYIAQFKFTVLILPTIIDKLNSFDLPFVVSEFSIEDNSINQLLAMGVKRSKKSKKKKKKKTGEEGTKEEDAKEEGGEAKVGEAKVVEAKVVGDEKGADEKNEKKVIIYFQH